MNANGATVAARHPGAGQERMCSMCGIVAMYSAREPIRADDLERATSQLAHRGPDGRRTGLRDDRRGGLGHARLSIIDLATGDQPIAGEDETLQIVVNGEFYYFERTPP